MLMTLRRVDFPWNSCDFFSGRRILAREQGRALLAWAKMSKQPVNGRHAGQYDREQRNKSSAIQKSTSPISRSEQRP